MPEKPPITSSELGSLWMTYQEKTMLAQMLSYFIQCADDEQAKKIMTDLNEEISSYINKMKQLFEQEGAAVPLAFTADDVNKGVPKLYDNCFDMMFIRLMKAISIGMHTVHLTMAYREDVIALYQNLTNMCQKYYNLCTQYLLQKGVLARPPYISMPTSIQFVHDPVSYMGGLNPLRNKRSLNTVEVGHLHRAIEGNITGMKLMIGFAQCAQNPDVKKHFVRGKELAQKIVHDFGKLLLDSDLQPPAAASGNVTQSTLAPFSDKMMMYCASLLSSFALGSNGIGTAFSLRKDLQVKLALYSKNIIDFAHDGGVIMIKNGWMEEPPQTEDRSQLIYS